MSFFETIPRSVWLSAAGGVSVAYVFVHLLPELAEHQRMFNRRTAGESGFLSWFESHIYLMALVGLSVFYGLDRLARLHQAETSRGADAPEGSRIFWIHLASFAVYNLLIGYLLVHREDMALRSLAAYAVAMGLHFFVNDQALRHQHGQVYDSRGRWILAAAPIAGWAAGIATAISAVAIASLFAFLAGGVVLNVLKEELPEDRESRFWAFAAGAGAYALLLMVSA